MSKTIIIMGSSNPFGDTFNVCKSIVDEHNFKFQDLNELVIMPYDYEHENSDDDFIGFMKHVVQSYDTIILASPVYWYSVSGIMKNFIDRFTDLLTIKKDMGRQLRGKSMLAISVSKSDDCPEEFSSPLRRTAEYLGMTWKGYAHFPVNEKNIWEDRLKTLSGFLEQD
ncbi:MAG: NAD(P)H-dependent oxidoreductase [Saprospiraceae bacterium]|nr:NAD(P)H-dependent oxidoreductase [Saprospiraceae bacterium]